MEPNRVNDIRKALLPWLPGAVVEALLDEKDRAVSTCDYSCPNGHEKVVSVLDYGPWGVRS